ncbi:MAG TPA: HEAT repeat domain-containing protein [Candidatus Kryptonia bacterium]|nr:HEAT repeat domain-containing protein [Candidatus Kryptonia bacterium]
MSASRAILLTGIATAVALMVIRSRSRPVPDTANTGETSVDLSTPQTVHHSAMNPQWPQTQPMHSVARPDRPSLLAERRAPAMEPAAWNRDTLGEHLATFATPAGTANDSSADRAMALPQLRAVAGRSVSDELLQALGDPDRDVRATALEELALDRLEWADDDDNQLSNALAAAMNDPSPTVRITALRLASESESDAGFALLQRGAGDTDEEVRRWAALLLAATEQPVPGK